MVKKTELMEGVADTHAIRPRRKEDIVDWLVHVRVLHKLEYYDHGLLSPDLCDMSDLMWDGTAKWYGWEAVGRSKTLEALGR